MPLGALVLAGTEVCFGGHVPGQVQEQYWDGPTEMREERTTSSLGSASRAPSRLSVGHLRDFAKIASGQFAELRDALKSSLSGGASVASARTTPRSSAAPSRSSSLDSAEDLLDLTFPQEPGVEFVPDLLDDLFSRELEVQLSPGYMASQPDLSGRMRAVLVDWLIEVHEGLRMHQTTLFLAVRLLDRYLSLRRVGRNELQRVGAVALLVAAKFEEWEAPSIGQLVALTKHTSTRQDIMRLECHFLRILGFGVMAPTAVNFFEIYQHVNHCDSQQTQLAQYIMELSLTDLSLVDLQPSRLAAGAVLLSNELTGRAGGGRWSPSMARAARCSEQSLADVTARLRPLLDAAPRSALRNTVSKFSKPERAGVAKIFPRP